VPLYPNFHINLSHTPAFYVIKIHFNNISVMFIIWCWEVERHYSIKLWQTQLQLSVKKCYPFYENRTFISSTGSFPSQMQARSPPLLLIYTILYPPLLRPHYPTRQQLFRRSGCRQHMKQATRWCTERLIGSIGGRVRCGTGGPLALGTAFGLLLLGGTVSNSV
jgi:hypothetical protein